MGDKIPVIVENPLGTCGVRKFQIDPLGDHLCTCTSHSGVKKTHDWVVDQLTDLFLTTRTVMSLVLDLHIAHDRFGSGSDLNLNGHLHSPNDIDQSLNEVTDDKIRKYTIDYNNNPPVTVAFMSDIVSTSGRLHCEFVRLLFLQVRRETDLFFVVSGVQLTHSTSGLFHFRRVVFSS
jgi:hypothetical protein